MSTKRKGTQRKRKRKSNPVPVIAINPRRRRKRKRNATMAKRSHTRRRRRRHNPGNPARRHHHTRRRRRNPASPWWRGPLGVLLAVLGGGAGYLLGLGLGQTNLSVNTMAALHMGIGTAGGLALSLLSPEAGGGLATASLLTGLWGLTSAQPQGQAPPAQKNMTAARSRAITMRRAALHGLDEDELDSLGAVTAMLGDVDDEEVLGYLGEPSGMGAVEMGDADDEEGFGAVEMGDADDDEEVLGSLGYA